jgi:hypothetical protein
MPLKQTIPHKTVTSTGHTNDSQRLAMLNWLEKDNNFKWITGSLAKELVVKAGQKLTKASAFEDMARFISKICSISWDAKVAKSRYESYCKMYKNAIQESLKTGFGITDLDRSQGITTVNAKLNKICPFFDRMNMLFGERQNIKPSNVQCTARPTNNAELTSIIDNNDGDEEAESNVLTCLADHQDETLAQDTRTPHVETYENVNHDPLAQGEKNGFESLLDYRNKSRSFSQYSVESESQESVESISTTAKKQKRKSDFMTSYTEDQARKLRFNQERFEFEKDLKKQEIILKQEELQLKKEELLASKEAKQEELRFQRTTEKEKIRSNAINNLISQGKSMEEIKKFLSLFD